VPRAALSAVRLRGFTSGHSTLEKSVSSRGAAKPSSSGHARWRAHDAPACARQDARYVGFVEIAEREVAVVPGRPQLPCCIVEASMIAATTHRTSAIVLEGSQPVHEA